MTENILPTEQITVAETIPTEVTEEKLKRAANPIDEVEFTEDEAQALGAFTEEAVSEDEALKSAEFDNMDKPL